MKPHFHPHPHGKSHRLYFGTVLILAGALLAAFNTGLLDPSLKKAFFNWPMLLVVFGLSKILCGGRWLFGTLLTALGLYWLLPRFGWHVPDMSTFLLPTVLVIIGLAVLLHRKNPPFRGMHRPSSFQMGTTNATPTNGKIEESAVFGGINRKYSGPFKGGEVSCVFGGCELDLSDTHLTEPVTELEVNCVFGGVTLIVPRHWRVQLRTSSVFGDFLDRTPGNLSETDQSQTLLIQGSCVFGGGEVRYSSPS